MKSSMNMSINNGFYHDGDHYALEGGKRAKFIMLTPGMSALYGCAIDILPVPGEAKSCFFEGFISFNVAVQH